MRTLKKKKKQCTVVDHLMSTCPFGQESKILNYLICCRANPISLCSVEIQQAGGLRDPGEDACGVWEGGCQLCWWWIRGYYIYSAGWYETGTKQLYLQCRVIWDRYQTVIFTAQGDMRQVPNSYIYSSGWYETGTKQLYLQCRVIWDRYQSLLLYLQLSVIWDRYQTVIFTAQGDMRQVPNSCIYRSGWYETDTNHLLYKGRYLGRDRWC